MPNELIEKILSKDFDVRDLTLREYWTVRKFLDDVLFYDYDDCIECPLFISELNECDLNTVLKHPDCYETTYQSVTQTLKEIFKKIANKHLTI